MGCEPVALRQFQIFNKPHRFNILGSVDAQKVWDGDQTSVCDAFVRLNVKTGFIPQTVPRGTTVTLEKNVRLTKRQRGHNDSTGGGNCLRRVAKPARGRIPEPRPTTYDRKANGKVAVKGIAKPCESLFNRLVPSEPSGFAFNC